MTSSFRKLITVATCAAVLPLSALASANTDSQAIRLQLQRYEQALNGADVDAVMQLYAADAVFMPQNSQPIVGRDAVHTAYTALFKSLKLDIKFEVDEVQPLSNRWAYARTRSSGTGRLLGSDQVPSAEANQELFLLHKERDGQWRFARYIFSSSKPAAQR